MDQVRISLQVTCPGIDADGAADLARDLRNDILNIEVDSAALGSAGPAPIGAKSGELIAVGAVVVALAPTVVASLVGVISSWLSRQPSDVEIEFEGHRLKGRVTRAQRDELVAAYLRRIDASS